MRNSVYIPNTVCEEKHKPGASKLQNILETPFKENNRVGRKQNGCLCSAQKYT